MSERKVIVPEWSGIRNIYDLRMCLWKLPDDARIEVLIVQDGKLNAELFQEKP